MTAADGRDAARESAPPGRRRHVRRLLLIVVGLGAAVLAGRVLYDNSDEVLAAADTLTHPRWAWVIVALVAEAASYLLRGAAHVVVLRAGVAHTVDRADPLRFGNRIPGLMPLSAAVLAGDAAAYCLPFGFAASGVVMFTVLRRRGMDATVAGWMYTVCAVLYVGSIAALTVLAVQVAGSADPVPGLWQVSIGLLLALVLIGAGYALVRRGRKRRAGTGGATRSEIEAVTGNGGSAVRRSLRARMAELRRIRLPARTGVLAFALMTLSWLCNIVVLAVAYEAVGSAPPWTGLLLAYCASQVAAAIPVTPGGIGVVEGSLTLALVAFGGEESVTLAAVLLYRLVTYWICIPLGGLAWLGLRVGPAPATRGRPTAAPAAQGGRR